MLWQMLIIVVASNLDDLGVGFSLGLKGRIPWRVIWIISILSGVTMAFGLFLGEELAFLLPGHLPVYFAALIFACIGLWFIWQGMKDNHDGKLLGTHQQLSWKFALLLGVALGIDSFAAGFSGGLTGFPIILTSVLAWLTSLLFLWFGSRFGGLVTIKLVKDYADYFSGFMFILLAVVILIL